MANIIIGKADWHFETGTEGVMWSVFEDGKTGYEGLHVLEAGDRLTIWNENGRIAFRGIIRPNYTIGRQPHPLNPRISQPVALGCWIHWTQNGWQPDDWAALFLRDVFGKTPLRAELIKK